MVMSSTIQTGRYPLPKEIENSKFDIYINVSDEYIESCHNAAMRANKKYFWFPLSEVTEMSLASIYGALQILHNAANNGKNVYLHCHAGTCRSVVVCELYQYMILGVCSKNAMFMSCIEEGVLPKLPKLEMFLSEALQVFQQQETTRGGCLDSVILKMEK